MALPLLLLLPSLRLSHGPDGICCRQCGLEITNRSNWIPPPKPNAPFTATAEVGLAGGRTVLPSSRLALYKPQYQFASTNGGVDRGGAVAAL